MFKKVVILFSVLLSCICFSQNTANSIPIKLKKDRDVFQVVDNQNNQVILFLGDKKRVESFKLDERMKVIDTLTVTRPDEKYKDMIGSCFENNKIGIVWATQNLKEINFQLFNFENHLTFNKEFKLKLENERFVQKISEGNKFYIITVVSESSLLKFYIFDIDGNLTEKNIDLTAINFKKSNQEKTNLYGLLKEKLGSFEPSFSLQKINIENATSLAESAKKRKCYIDSKNIILTFDTNNDYTQLIKIDTQNFTSSEYIYNKPSVDSENNSRINSNSFLYKNDFYQIMTSPEYIKLNLKKLDSNFTKEWIVKNDIEIDFKNSELIDEISSGESRDSIDKTSKFIRKVNNLNVGISCSKNKGNNLLTVGGVSEIIGGGSARGIAFGAMFGVIGVMMYYAIDNPTIESFNSNANRNVVYMNCLFDENSNHVDVQIDKLAYNKIATYLQDIEDFENITLFKLNNDYFLGYYYKVQKKFVIRKFSD